MNKLIYVLILLNVLVFLASFEHPSKFIIENFGMSYKALTEGRVYVFITSGFLHADILHLFWNCLFLFLFGRVVEEEFGIKIFAVVYFFSMIVGNIFFAVLFPQSYAIGASGAVFGLMAASMLVEPFRPIVKIIPVPLALMGTVYLMGAVFSAFSTDGGIAHIAHVGGAIGGTIIAFWKEGERAKSGLVVAILFFMLVLAVSLLGF